MVQGRPRIFPSKKWREWIRDARIRFATTSPFEIIDYPVNCEAIFYRERNAGDAVGYYQGLADFLEICLFCRKKKCSCRARATVMEDDKWIVSWNGSRMEKDKDNPRVEVALAPIGSSTPSG